MIQNPKGGGLSSAFGGGNQIMGARKTSDFLEKTTWTLAIILVSLALLSNFAIPRTASAEEQDLLEEARPSETDLEENSFDDINIDNELDNNNVTE
tara:strand:- start:991 stop:1278 length:288 start_codon:yes stop_codon:yes gene_type:complete